MSDFKLLILTTIIINELKEHITKHNSPPQKKPKASKTS